MNHDAELHSALAFTRADLEANRQGRLSETQRRRLQRHSQRSQRLAWGIGGLSLGLLGLGLLAGGLMLAMLGSIALLGGVFWLLEMIGGRSYHRASQQHEIISIQGRVQYLGELDWHTNVHALTGIRIGAETFLLDESRVLAFEEGAVYILYYTAASRTLLSAERAFVPSSRLAAHRQQQAPPPPDEGASLRNLLHED